MDSGTDGFGHLMDPTANMETNLDSLISEVYANNQEELAPCLDGLGAEEAMQQQDQQNQQLCSFSSSANAGNAFETHMSFTGPNSGITFPIHFGISYYSFYIIVLILPYFF